jgi:hypothetical protein
MVSGNGSTMSAYSYTTPVGYGDIWYAYVYDAGSALTNGSSYSQLEIPVDNYDFIARHWAGWDSVIDTPANGGLIQAYDGINRAYANVPMALGGFKQGQVILPEKMYRVNSAIRFDLAQVLKAANAGTFASQLVWTGVRRIPGWGSDPAPSPFNFKLVRQYYPFTLVVQQAPVAAANYSIPITDYDFQLERVELTPYSNPSKFSITLQDNNKINRSNLPINCNRFFHLNPNGSGGEVNFKPAPPILYKVNSSINFSILSRIGAGGPLTFQLLFVGSRRIPCQ